MALQAFYVAVNATQGEVGLAPLEGVVSGGRECES